MNIFKKIFHRIRFFKLFNIVLGIVLLHQCGSDDSNDTTSPEHIVQNVNYYFTNALYQTNDYNLTNEYNQISSETNLVLETHLVRTTNSVSSANLTTHHISNYYTLITNVKINHWYPYIGSTTPKLLISEVGSHGGNNYFYANSWIEIYNPNAAFTINLSNYQIKGNGISLNVATGKISDISHQTFSLPDIELEGKTYLLIRFSVVKYYSNASGNNDMFFFYEVAGNNYSTPSLKDNSGNAHGYFELIRNNETVDYVGICTDNSDLGGAIANPTTGNQFSSCLAFTGDLGSSATRDVNLSDTDDKGDWTVISIATPGGKNDVIDTTDNDNDGIPDANELDGTTFAGLPLYDWGARVNTKDIFVHINYMSGWETDNGLNPFEESLQKVKNAFTAKNVGIHFDVGNKYHSVYGASPVSFDLSDSVHEVPNVSHIEVVDYVTANYPGLFTNNDYSDTVYTYKYKYMPAAKLQIFHYMLVANHIKFDGEELTAVGVGELPGNDTVIAWGDKSFLGSDRTYAINQMAYTIMHELGHNLNLRHGGFENGNYKPNYLSTMNYLYDKGLPRPFNTSSANLAARYYVLYKPDIVPSGYPKTESEMLDGPYSENFRIDYSSGSCPNLIEYNLVEINGINCMGLGGVDWNLSGLIWDEPSITDIDNNEQYLTLRDYNDWDNLLLPFSQSGLSGFNDYTPNGGSTSKIKGTKKLDPLANDSGNWVE